jgi:hypothetical protein
MGYAGKLVVREVSPADAASKVAGLLKLPEWNASHVVTAGAHSIRYDYQSEIPFGPALHSVTIVGPSGSAISRRFGKYPVFAPRSPYQSALGWYAFVEWRGDTNGQGSSAVVTFDLALGEIVGTQEMKHAGFVGWRGGASREYIVQDYDKPHCSNWLACDARTGEKRRLFRGGYEGHVSADGRYLFVLDTRTVFVALISTDSGSLLDLKKAADFQSYVQRVTGLDTVSFDPRAARLTSMLNWTGTDYQANQVTFEKLITIEVSTEAEPGS